MFIFFSLTPATATVAGLSKDQTALAEGKSRVPACGLAEAQHAVQGHDALVGDGQGVDLDLLDGPGAGAAVRESRQEPAEAVEPPEHGGVLGLALAAAHVAGDVAPDPGAVEEALPAAAVRDELDRGDGRREAGLQGRGEALGVGAADAQGHDGPEGLVRAGAEHELLAQGEYRVGHELADQDAVGVLELGLHLREPGRGLGLGADLDPAGFGLVQGLVGGDLEHDLLSRAARPAGP